jgi:glycosyltransferase involved in cell wall biosynthesis
MKDDDKDAQAAEIIRLRAEVYRLRDELHSLKNARLLGKIIRARDVIGKTSRRTVALPKKTVHGLRVTVAPLVPKPVRKKIKRVGGTLIRYGDHFSSKQLVMVENEAWGKAKPLVSIIIPYYNAGVTIDETLQSLVEQTFQNFEVIIVNDGSTDPSSITKLEELQKDFTRAHYIHQSNQGVAAARNNGLLKASGKYVICLDSDDKLEATFVEKCTTILETDPDVSFVTTNQDIFGVVNEHLTKPAFDPLRLERDNMVIVAAEVRREAWQKSGGYKTKIGYEDWEYWLNLSEKGYWGKLIPQPLFLYRTSMQSRYVDDKDLHWSNAKAIKGLHPHYKRNVTRQLEARKGAQTVVSPESAFINLNDRKQYAKVRTANPRVLIAIPWMTVGGAETLLYNYCKKLKDQYDISFVTGLADTNEWEYKFREITDRIYHMPNLLKREDLYLEFLSNYIGNHDIQLLHIVHNGFMFAMLPELKKRHPALKVAVTMFNDGVSYFQQSVDYQHSIDIFSTENKVVVDHYRLLLEADKPVKVIPNGVDCQGRFNPDLFDRQAVRAELSLADKDLAVLFVGRLSEEKEPIVFVEAAAKVIAKQQSARFFIIGDGPMRAEVERVVKRLDSKRVRYLGYQSDVPKYLAAADVFVLPSSIDGFPAALLEAMAMRTVVVASRLGAIPEIIDSEKNGFTVTPASADEIADKILEFSKDAGRIEAIKNLARATIVRDYSSDTLGRNYSTLYQEALKCKGGNAPHA